MTSDKTTSDKESFKSHLHYIVKCNTWCLDVDRNLVMENFIRGFVVETFSGSVIDMMSEELDVFLRIVFDESFLGDKPSDESVGIFDSSFFPRGVWMAEVGFA